MVALEKNSPDFTPREISELALTGDPDAIQIFVEVGRALGIGLAALVNTLNLPLYVIGGGLANSWNLFSPTLFEELRQCSYVYRMTDPDQPPHREVPSQKRTSSSLISAPKQACSAPASYRSRCFHNNGRNGQRNATCPEKRRLLAELKWSKMGPGDRA